MKVWLNGDLVAPEQATVSVLDRGFLFGDGVYELVCFFGGVGVGMAAHVARLRASLAESRIHGFPAEELPGICAALLESNGLADASVYIQVTRGAGTARQHVPQPGLRPTVFASAAALPPLDAMRGPAGLRAILQEDRRWQRCSIKTTSLMGNILALMDADDADAEEAILHRGGFVGEGTHTNVFAFVDGTLVTPPIDADPPILHGVTRILVAEAAEDAGVPFAERPLPVHELLAAEEVMITSSRKIVAAIVQIDGRPVGTGAIGPVARSVYDRCRQRIADECGLATAPTTSRIAAGAAAEPRA